MAKLATINDVKRQLHDTEDSDEVTLEAFGYALESAEDIVTSWLRQDFTQIGSYVDGPEGLGVAALTSGGTFGPGTYYWKVSALVDGEETAASNETQAELAQNDSARLGWLPLEGATEYKVFRATVTGGQNTSPTLIAEDVKTTTFTDTGFSLKSGRAIGATQMYYDVAEDGYVPNPLLNATVIQVRFYRTPKASAYIGIPILDWELHQDGRIIRFHPTFFDVPFEGAVSAHLPENWARVEVDYTPATTSVPAGIRDGVAITAAAIYQRGPTSASGFTSERIGDYEYVIRPLKGQGDQEEAIPDLAKQLLRRYKKRTAMVP